MADIAFLLLIFFLVTTTMDTDKGILRQLPPPVKQPENLPQITERNLFKVKVNRQDQLLVEDEIMKISELKERTKDFYTNPMRSEKLPKQVTITRKKCNKKITELKGKLERATKNKQAVKRELKVWKERKKAVELFNGSFKTLPKDALISLRNDRGTSYDMYIQVQNELTAALNELRNEFIRTHPAFPDKFKSQKDFKPNEVEAHRKYVKALRQKYPQRISEAEPTDAAK